MLLIPCDNFDKILRCSATGYAVTSVCSRAGPSNSCNASTRLQIGDE